MHEKPTQGGVRKRKQRRSEVDYARSRLFCAALAGRAHIRCSGQTLEAHFDGDKIRKKEKAFGVQRNCKWDRYLRDGTNPSPNTIALAETKYPGVSHWLALPLWDALRAAPLTHEERQIILSRLSPSVRIHLYSRRLGRLGELRPLTIQKVPIYAIAKECTLDALTCLIVLIREAQEAGDLRLLYGVETCTRAIFRRLVCIDPFKFVAIDLLHLIRQHVLRTNWAEYHIPSPWNFSDDELTDFIYGRHALLLLLEDIFVINVLEGNELRILTLVDQGRVKRIVDEAYAYYRERVIPPDDDNGGLFWLARKLRPSRNSKPYFIQELEFQELRLREQSRVDVAKDSLPLMNGVDSSAKDAVVPGGNP